MRKKCHRVDWLKVENWLEDNISLDNYAQGKFCQNMEVVSILLKKNIEVVFHLKNIEVVFQLLYAYSVNIQ